MSGGAELAKQLAEAKRKLAIEAEMVAEQATADLAGFKMHFDAEREAAQAWRQARLDAAIAVVTRQVNSQISAELELKQVQLDEKMVVESDARIAAELARSAANKAEAAAQQAEQAEMQMNMFQVARLKKEAAARLKAEIKSAAAARLKAEIKSAAAARLKAKIKSAAAAKRSAAEALARAVNARNKAGA